MEKEPRTTTGALRASLFRASSVQTHFENNDAELGLPTLHFRLSEALQNEQN